mmetsp:Transcript_2869/g.5565  ORF Transcript_2869/g.5565 Transcript_2869/m.5565 type:complete len:207 (-) Transcript_2869:359-979(-)
MHKPTWDSRTCQVFPSCNNVCFHSFTFQTSSRILQCKGTISENGDRAPFQFIIWCVVIHAIPDLTVKELLSWIFNDAVLRETPWEIEDAGDWHLFRWLASQGVHNEFIVAILCTLVSHDGHGRDVGFEINMRQQAKLLGGKLKVLLDLPLVWPDAPTTLTLVGCFSLLLNWVGQRDFIAIGIIKLASVDAVLPPPDVERAKLCLQP